MSFKSYTHSNPVWRERANFIIGAKCSNSNSQTQEWEQLWAKQTADNRFEICCIPFFVYDLALGDEVETAPEWGQQYMVQQVVKSSGRYTFRVWFGSSSEPTARTSVPLEVSQLGCLMEFSSENLLAVDAATAVQARSVADLLLHREHLGHLVFETGRT